MTRPGQDRSHLLKYITSRTLWAILYGLNSMVHTVGSKVYGPFVWPVVQPGKFCSICTTYSLIHAVNPDWGDHKISPLEQGSWWKAALLNQYLNRSPLHSKSWAKCVSKILKFGKWKFSGKMSLNVPTLKLNNGIEMPQFGLGTWLRYFCYISSWVYFRLNFGHFEVE